VNVKEDLLTLWVNRGAQPTDTVASLLKKWKAAVAAPQEG
jgi:ribosomal protein S16